MRPNFFLLTLAELRPGDHLCCLYETEEEHRAVLLPFLRQGLERGEKVIYIVDAHTGETVLDYLRADGVTVDSHLKSGQLRILSRDDTYLRQGVFDPEGMIALVRTETARALAEGYPALRVTGEMTWALRGLPGSERLIEYEAKLNDFFPGSKCLAICQYDRRRFDPAVLLDVLHTHPIAVIGTEVYENYCYEPPSTFLENRPAARLHQWAQALADRKRAERELRNVHRALRVLSECNQTLVRAAEEAELLLGVCRVIVETGGYRLAWVGFAEQDQAKTVQPVAQWGYEAGYLHGLNLTWAETESGRGPTGTAIRTGKPAFAQNILTDPDFAPWRAEATKRGYASSIALPLTAEGRTLGALNIYATEPDAFDPAEVKLLTDLASDLVFGMATVRIRAERQRAEEALVARTRHLEAVRTVAEEVTRELDLATLLDLITRRSAELVGAASGVVSLWDEGVEGLVPRAWDGLGEWMADVRLGLREGVSGTIAQRREGMIINDFRTSPYAHPLFLERTAITAVLGEPLLYRDRLLGVITVNHQGPERTFTEEDRQVLSLFAAQAAIAIENARLFQEALEKTHRLEGLARTSAKIAGTQRLEEVLRGIAEEAAKLLSVEGAGFRLLEGDRLVVGGTYGLAQHVMLTPALRVGESLTGRVAQEARPIAVPNIREDQTYLPDHRAAALAHGVVAYLGVPLRSRDRIIGVLNVYGKERRVFLEGDIRLLSTFADHAAVAIENARLYEELRLAAIQLEAKVEDRTRDLQEAIRQLEVASRHKSEFLANMSHELRTPLNSVIGFASVLLEQPVGSLNEKQTRYLTHIHNSGQHLLQLINDILDLSKVEAGKITLHLEPLAVAATLGDILVIARGLANEKAQSVEAEIAPKLPPLRADLLRFKQICFNLLSNAVKFTPAHGRITLVAHRAQATGESLELRVTDTGIGIKAEDVPRLFQEFVQLEAAGTKPQEGTGLGLALTKRLVELHGGRIWAESAGEGQGSAFTVLLPFAGPREGSDASAKASPHAAGASTGKDGE